MFFHLKVSLHQVYLSFIQVYFQHDGFILEHKLFV